MPDGPDHRGVRAVLGACAPCTSPLAHRSPPLGEHQHRPVKHTRRPGHRILNRSLRNTSATGDAGNADHRRHGGMPAASPKAGRRPSRPSCSAGSNHPLFRPTRRNRRRKGNGNGPSNISTSRTRTTNQATTRTRTRQRQRPEAGTELSQPIRGFTNYDVTRVEPEGPLTDDIAPAQRHPPGLQERPGLRAQEPPFPARLPLRRLRDEPPGLRRRLAGKGHPPDAHACPSAPTCPGAGTWPSAGSRRPGRRGPRPRPRCGSGEMRASTRPTDPAQGPQGVPGQAEGPCAALSPEADAPSRQSHALDPAPNGSSPTTEQAPSMAGHDLDRAQAERTRPR